MMSPSRGYVPAMALLASLVSIVLVLPYCESRQHPLPLPQRVPVAFVGQSSAPWKSSHSERQSTEITRWSRSGIPATSSPSGLRSLLLSLRDAETLESSRTDLKLDRRDFVRTSANIGVAGLGSYFLRPRSASAADVANAAAGTTSGTATSSTTSPTSRASTLPTIVSNSLCDPSVSSWVKAYDDSTSSMRTIHILGTAHISSASAELAGTLVREIKPNVVFVELDAKRVSRAVPGGVGGGATSTVTSQMDTKSTVAPTPTGTSTVVPAGTTMTNDASASSGAITSTPSTDYTESNSGKQRFHNPFDVQSQMVNAGSKYLGNAVKGMYGKLESEGFKAGDEFAMSVKEGLAIGSTIVLGDRDVEVTLKRLTRALTKTDIRKLLSSDSEVEKSMEAILPENMKRQLEQSSSAGMESAVAVDKQEFKTFVETMKAKENVRNIMNALKTTAPEIYQAMVAERDEYMGRGLDELGSTMGNKSADMTVAVMGMAHVDGVERYLESRGWREMKYPCSVLVGR